MALHTVQFRAFVFTAVAAGCLAFLPGPVHAAPASPARSAALRVDAAGDGYRYVAGAGQDNNVIVTADADSIEIKDTAVTTLGEVPDGCEPVPAEEGAAVACPYTGTIVVAIRLRDGFDILDGSYLPTTVGLLFVGGDGDNVVYGGAGDDVLWGGDDPDATDTMYGWLGDDVLHARRGHGYLRGHAGDDRIVGGSGIDLINADAGDDTVFGGGDLNFIGGNAGADRLFGGPDYDSLDGGRGADRLFGKAGSDTLRAGPGRDRLIGGFGEDDLVTQGDRTHDVARCGPGSDTAYVNRRNRDRLRSCETQTSEQYRTVARPIPNPVALPEAYRRS